jgi:phosphate transport system permease protein
MTVVSPPSPQADDPSQWLLHRSISTRRRVVNGLASAWMIGSLLLVMVPLLFIVVQVVSRGAGVISSTFLSSDLPIQRRSANGGIKPAIVGTVAITGTAALLAIPLGVLGAIYLNEYGRNRVIARVIRFMADVMSGVPSIVMGLFISMIWVSGGLGFGYSGFAGALALAALMLPIVIRSTEEMLKLVPDDLRQASDALGARRWRTVVSVALPAALPGIVSGAMLAIARAAGETAPLLFTIGVVRSANWNVFEGTNTALSQEIWFNAQTPFEHAQDRAWGAALTLIAIVFVCTVIARLVSNRFAMARR